VIVKEQQLKAEWARLQRSITKLKTK